MEAWAYQAGAQMDSIQPGRPVQTGYIESFNGRPHNALTDRTAAEFLNAVDCRPFVFPNG